MHPLFNHINKVVPITLQNFEVLLEYFTEKTLKKKEFLLEEGEICQWLAFIIKGSMRQYYVDENGSEHILHLYIENWWAFDRESFTLHTPSLYTIDAWEDCEVLLISKDNLEKLRCECHAFNALLRNLDDLNTIGIEKRITYSITFTTDIRYKIFAASFPHFIKRFPQHIIASYLGITKDTLSRIRNKIR